MKIAIIGYGKMGKTIERIAKERGHEIVSVIDSENLNEFDSPAFASADVAIEFSTPATACDNYVKAFSKGVAVVSGTTGWIDRMEEMKAVCNEKNAAFFYSSNFSIGVNLFFELNKRLAKLMNKFSQYDVSINEIHHIHKLDHPSGTAITLANGILDNLDRKDAWTETEEGDDKLRIDHQRIGEVPGTHTVCYKSAVDSIKIEHEAFSREGFALGAVIAAEWMCGKKGCYSMEDMLNFKDL